MKIETRTLWVVALAEFSSIRLSAHHTQKEALHHLGAAATIADAWKAGEGADRFYAALEAEQWSLAETIAGNETLPSHLRWELRRFDAEQPGFRNSLNPLI